MWHEIKRKIFHLAALVYVVGLIYMPRPVYLIVLTCLFALELSLEIIRLKNAATGRWFAARFGGLMREEEKSKLSGVFWMLLGVLTTVLVAKPVPMAASALLYLILGDAIASLVGMRFGGPHWTGSKKRMSGSLACFAVCLFVGVVLLRPSYEWHVVVIGALAATFLEHIPIRINDNFLIPTGSALALLISHYSVP